MFQDTSIDVDTQVETSMAESRVEVGICAGEQTQLASGAGFLQKVRNRVKAPTEGGWSEPSNTDPYKIHLVNACSGYFGSIFEYEKCIPSIKMLYSGVDWLAVVFSGVPCDSDTLARLSQIQESLVADTCSESELFELGGMSWRMGRHGSGVGLSRFKFVLFGDGITLMLSDSENQKALKGCLQLQGQFCSGQDPQLMYRRAKRLAWDCGIRATLCKVQRLDFCVDVVGLAAAFFAMLQFENWIVKRSKEWQPFLTGDNVCTGAQFGKRGQDVFLRVYDKAAELQKNPEKLARYLDLIRADRLPVESLTRIEFETHSEFYRETMRFEDADAVFESLSLVAAYLMEDWFRVCSKIVQRNNTLRAVAADWWADARLELMRTCRGHKEYLRYPKPSLDEQRLTAQVIGIVGAIEGAIHEQGGGTVESIFLRFASRLTTEHEVALNDKIENSCRDAAANREAWVEWMQKGSTDAA